MAWFRDNDLVFKKTGAKVKEAVRARIADLEQRLAKRNAQLDLIMQDKPLRRSYLVRNPRNDWPHGGQMQQENPSEEHQEITELCRRICVIEKELLELRMIVTHLRDDQELDLAFADMVKYGFPAAS
jgi:hypothetical protein